MTRQTRAVVAGVLACVLILGGAIGGSYVLALTAINQRDHVWCPALRQLTSHPVRYPSDPAANPSRVESYRLYTQFVAIRDGLGCGS